MSQVDNRVLHIISGSTVGGGIETMVINLYKQINRGALQFDFILFGGEVDFHKEIIDMGGRIYYLKPLRESNLIKYYISIINVMRKNKYKKIHVHMSYYSFIYQIAGILAGVKQRISHAHIADWPRDNSIKNQLLINLMRVLNNLTATNLVACSKIAGDFCFGERFSKKITIIPNAINLNTFIESATTDITDFRKKLGIPLDKKVVGHIGYFGYSKNHHFLVDIIEKMKYDDYYWILIGEGDYKKEIIELVELRGLSKNVEFMGYQKDIPSFLKLFDLFILPSRYEGLPLVLVEAQAFSLPCIVSDTISKEVDLGLSLINYVGLHEDTEKWRNVILEHSIQKEIPKREIGQAFSKKGYDIKSSVKLINSLYHIEV